MIYDTILQRVSRGEKMLVRLVDPDKFDPATLCEGFDCYFVGGSTATGCTAAVRAIHERTHTPCIIFPGHPRQYTAEADGLLYLTLMNSRDPRFLIDMQLQSADDIVASGIETIPMGYILIDGGRVSTTQRITGAEPVSASQPDEAVRLARVAQLMGKRLIYLEAGSGALQPVPGQLIRAVKQAIRVPLIVGGGICTAEQMSDAFDAGADIVVIGNHFEQHPDEQPLFIAQHSKRSAQNHSEEDEKFMRLALHEAQKAFDAGEIPVGCVVVAGGRIIGRGHNLTQCLHDVTAHAEMQAITAAAEELNGKYLQACTLYVTVEPCVMCAGAIGWAQVSRLVFGAPDPKRGYQLFAPKALHPKCTVTSGVLAQECQALMQQFFESLRS